MRSGSAQGFCWRAETGENAWEDTAEGRGRFSRVFGGRVVRLGGELEPASPSLVDTRPGADSLQRPRRSRFRQRLTPGVEMIGIATACVNRRSCWRKCCPNHQIF